MSAELLPELAPCGPSHRSEPIAERRSAWPADVELSSLLARAADGDVDAFAEFYDATCTLAWRLALRRWRARQPAEAATYRRFILAWERAAEHASSGLSPRAWLLSLAADVLTVEP